MKDHRLTVSSSLSFKRISRPSSNFDYVDEQFQGEPAIRRLFSQSRAFGGKTLITEDMPAEGVIKVENEEIAGWYPDHRMVELKRLTFWKAVVKSKSEMRRLTAEKLLGYAIVKRDRVPSKSMDRWHVFESVFARYPHPHNYVAKARMFKVRAGEREFVLSGVMYCQQNGLNKACAQVALRSLCAPFMRGAELSYRQINRLADRKKPGFNPAEGLEAVQIHAVLKGLGIEHSDVDYKVLPRSAREKLPYQKYMYAGIESGAGALLGFQLAGPKAEGHHIIPFFGHTFNQDTWVPNADAAYFHVGEKTRYIPSESWASSFIGHDDNFGSNFCVPRLYVTPRQAQYVVALHPRGVRYSGVIAEVIGVDYLYSLLPDLRTPGEKWLQRLVDYVEKQQVVLRALPLNRDEYIQHLRSMRDWQWREEQTFLCDALRMHLPARLWMVEVSVPELFPINQRKLGEIVLDATKRPPPPSKRPRRNPDLKVFLFGRFPGRFLLLERVNRRGEPSFISVPSNLKSHTPLFTDERTP